MRDGAGQRRVREALRERILRGEAVPGQRLVEVELAEQYAVARAGVRAALIDLAADGLVERIQHRGARVRVVSLAEAIEITECRAALESLCAAKAAQHVSTVEVAELVALGERMGRAVAAGDLLGYSDLNHALHALIREISGQRTAARTIERLRGQFVRHQYRLALQPGRASASLPEHERIIAAVVARDPAGAERAMRDHLASVIDALRTAGEEQDLGIVHPV